MNEYTGRGLNGMAEKKKEIKNSSGMDIPNFEFERLARCLLPKIQKFFESDEGKREFEKWKREQENKDK